VAGVGGGVATTASAALAGVLLGAVVCWQPERPTISAAMSIVLLALQEVVWVN
jgi:hypothetical protein